MSGSTDHSRVWAQAEEQLPAGWGQDGRCCASTGLAPADRVEDWAAVAIGLDGGELTYRVAEPDEESRGLMIETTQR